MWYVAICQSNRAIDIVQMINKRLVKESEWPKNLPKSKVRNTRSICYLAITHAGFVDYTRFISENIHEKLFGSTMPLGGKINMDKSYLPDFKQQY